MNFLRNIIRESILKEAKEPPYNPYAGALYMWIRDYTNKIIANLSQNDEFILPPEWNGDRPRSPLSYVHTCKEYNMTGNKLRMRVDKYTLGYIVFIRGGVLFQVGDDKYARYTLENFTAYAPEACNDLNHRILDIARQLVADKREESDNHYRSAYPKA